MAKIMYENDDYWLEILRHNKGFGRPEQWVEYARHNNFKKIKAKKYYCCPDCGYDVLSPFGQYINYSTLITVKECKNCGLIFSDTHIDPGIITQHFEIIYKDEYYFSYQRKFIFNYVSALVDKYCSSKGKILDIGGGMGHLLSIIAGRRPDLELTLADLSEKSCNYANQQFGIKTFCDAIPRLSKLPIRFNLILLIDVIYYESDVKKMWDVVDGLLNTSGTLIIRIPNRLVLMRLNRILSMKYNSRHTISQETHIKFFNPDHIYIFSKNYLSNKFKSLGFINFTVLPSPLLIKNRHMAIFNYLYFLISQLIYKLSFRKILLTPSIIVIASKGG